MHFEYDDIQKFNRKLVRSTVVHEGFFIGTYHINPRVIHLSRSRGNIVSPTHTHKIWEFNLLLKGKMEFFWQEKSVIIESGDIFFMQSERRHGWKLLSDDFLILGIQSSLSPAGSGSSSIQLKKLMDSALEKLEHHISGDTEISDAAWELINQVSSETPFYKERVHLLLRSIFLRIFEILFPEGMKCDVEDEEDSLRLSGLKTAEIMEYYLSDNLNKAVKPSDLCRRFGVSKCQLNRICKKETGLTVSEFIAHGKLNFAKWLLTHSSKMVKEIASMTGYPDVNYFCRIFRKYVGITPESYRKEALKNSVE